MLYWTPPCACSENGGPTLITSTDGTRLSFVVLPFVNRSDDSTEDYLADVIGDELTNSLSLLLDSLVISRSTGFQYKGKSMDVRQVGKDLSVRYALEGSVQPTVTGCSR